MTQRVSSHHMAQLICHIVSYFVTTCQMRGILLFVSHALHVFCRINIEVILVYINVYPSKM